MPTIITKTAANQFFIDNVTQYKLYKKKNTAPLYSIFAK